MPDSLRVDAPRRGWWLALVWLCLAATVRAEEYHAIRVIDEETGRGVPLVALRTVNNIRYYTDSAGVIALHEPGLMGREVFFFIEGHGYEVSPDGFGYRGVRLTPTPGGRSEVRVRRVNIAERLYRITGGGIYRDSVLLGWPVPLREPVLNGLVLGQDSVQSIVYGDRILFLWGDTSRPAYPLGNFQMSGARARLPGDGGLSPADGIDLTYFVDENGFAREMAPVPGPGPCWVDGLMTARDDSGRERLFATYAKVRGDMTATQRGFLVFDDETEKFRPIGTFPVDAAVLPGGHPFRHTVDGVDYYYHPRGFPWIRVRAESGAMTDQAAYEAYTCLKKGSTETVPLLDRDERGALRYAWKRDAGPLMPLAQEKLLVSGTLRPEEARFRLYDVVTGRPIIVHGMSVSWNAYRGRWVAVVLEIHGTSLLGEIWLAEADRPLGPWRYARKIVTHGDYSFYNPRHHPFFDEEGGRRVYFEATYTAMFSGSRVPTPRYDYNQIMYRVDLADPRLILPVPVYRAADGRLGTIRTIAAGEVPPTPAFLAADRPLSGGVAVVARKDGGLDVRSLPVQEQAVFHALPAGSEASPVTGLLYAFDSPGGGPPQYALEGDGPVGWKRSAAPLCRVWRDPRTIRATAAGRP